MNGNSVISTYLDTKINTVMLTWNQDPFVRGKVVRINSDKDAEKFERSANEHGMYAKVEGYNIYILPAGFTESTGYIVPQEEIKKIITVMARWYLTNAIDKWSNGQKNKFKTNKTIA